jgi:RNA polymerase sigma-70 factor (ECF subfamily)
LEAGEKTELRGRVHTALDRLPPKYKAVLTLRDIQGFSCEEIGEIVGCTNATVRWRLHRARKLFRSIWDGREVEVEEDEERTESF